MRFKILTIDDKSDNLLIIRDLLKEVFGDVTVLTAESGLEGIEIAKAEDPDVILLDVLMPHMDGFEVCKILKEDLVMRDIPVIFLTALKECRENRIAALEVGADAFLSKPIDVTELKVQIWAMLRIREALLAKRDEKERLKRLVAERTEQLEEKQEAMANTLKELREEIGSKNRVERALTESETKFHNIMSSMQDIVFTLDSHQRHTGVYGPWINRLGLTEEMFIGKTAREVLGDEFAELHEEANSRALKGEFVVYEWSLSNGDDTLHFQTSLSPLFAENGEVKGIVCIGRDITELKKTEKKLAKRESFLNKVFDTLPIGLWFADEKGTLIRGNPAGIKIWGGEPKVSMNKYGVFRAKRIETGEYIAADDWALAKTVKDKITVENELLEIEAFDGKKRIVLNYTAPVLDDEDKLVGAIVVNNDITELKRKEAKEEILYRISESLIKNDDVIKLCDSVRKILSQEIDTTNFYIALYDEQSDQLYFPYGIDDHNVFETIPAGKTLTKYAIEAGKPQLVKANELKQLIKNGTVELVGLTCKCWLGVPLIVDKQVIGLLAVQSYEDEDLYSEEDIKLLNFVSEQIGIALKRADTAKSLKNFKKRIDNLSRQTKTFFWEVDKDFKFTYLSEVAEEVIGYKLDDLIGELKFSDLIPDCFQQEFAEKLTGIMSQKGDITGFEIPLLSADGGKVWLSSDALPLSDLEGNFRGYQGISMDITKRRLAELEQEQYEKIKEQLAQTEKMYAIGELTSGIAHDFNNMLMIILNYSEMALNSLDQADRHYHIFLEIKNIAEKSHKLAQHLLSFARKQKRESLVCDLNSSINMTIDMLRRLVSSRISVLWNPKVDVWQVTIDESYLEQIVLNLCINARDAISNKGTIAISLDNVTDDGIDYVVISVADDGYGMDEETQKHIFEAFFTTKASGKGTGLGLSTVQKIVAESNGKIELNSHIGIGSCFKVFLPRTLDFVVDESNSFSSQLTFLGSSEEVSKDDSSDSEKVVLVVDDDKSILNVLEMMITELGFKAMISSNPIKALQIIEAERANIDVVLVDYHMPNMTGAELIEKALVIEPELKVIYMSGSLQGISRLPLNGMKFALTKPFTMKKLRTTLNKLMKGKPQVK